MIMNSCYSVIETHSWTPTITLRQEQHCLVVSYPVRMRSRGRVIGLSVSQSTYGI